MLTLLLLAVSTTCVQAVATAGTKTIQIGVVPYVVGVVALLVAFCGFFYCTKCRSRDIPQDIDIGDNDDDVEKHKEPRKEETPKKKKRQKNKAKKTKSKRRSEGNQ